MNFPLPLRFGVRAKSPHCKIVGENKMTLQLFHTTVAVRKTQKMRWVLQHVKKIFPSFLSAFDVFFRGKVKCARISSLLTFVLTFPPPTLPHPLTAMKRENEVFLRDLWAEEEGGERELSKISLFPPLPPPCGKTLFKHKVKIFWGAEEKEGCLETRRVLWGSGLRDAATKIRKKNLLWSLSGAVVRFYRRGK